jgi:phasin family protein
MANTTEQFTNQAQEATRSIVGAFQGATETQFNILQRLGGIQQDVFKQTIEAANEQLQVISRVRHPREFADAQAGLVKRHGQRYVDSIKQAVDITAEAWEEQADRLKRGVDAAADKAQRATSSRKSS